MSGNLELIQATYEGSSEQNGRNLLAVLAPDAEWTEAEGFPYAGTYVGPEAIVAGVFRRLATEWTGYRADARTYLEDGDHVAVFGTYSGTYNATGKAMRAAFGPGSCAMTRTPTGRQAAMRRTAFPGRPGQAATPPWTVGGSDRSRVRTVARSLCRYGLLRSGRSRRSLRML